MITLYSASVPLLKNLLGNLLSILKKGEQDALARQISPEVFLNARLAPDMFALVRQVQIATDMAKGAAARLAGIEPPKFADNETTFEALFDRINRTLDFLSSVSPQQIDGAESREIKFSIGEHHFKFTGEQYLSEWVLPNFFFHVTTAYNILRHNGVAIGKRDFLGS